MEKLIQGIQRFQNDVFAARRDFFRELANGQRPQALFITCADSRMVPDMICQTDPGDLFVSRNAGNIVPPHMPGAASGEAATIEYAIKGLGIRNVIVCGHTRCGAMDAVLHPAAIDGMPRVGNWLQNAAAASEIVHSCYGHLSPDARWNVMAQENVLNQIENLRTHPSVAAGLAVGELHLHAWVYKMETGQVFAFDPDSGQFSLLVQPSGELSTPRSMLRSPLGQRLGTPAPTRDAV